MVSVAAYVRVSSEQQADNLSIPTQRRAISEYARRQGLPTPVFYEDRAVSAFTDDVEKRPAFALLISDAVTKGYDIVLVADLDRLARNTVVALTVARRLARVGCRIVSLNQSTDLSTPDGELLYTINSGVNQYASAQIARKTRAGLAHIRAHGGHIGGVPFGARRDAARRLEIDPARADALRLLLTLAADHAHEAVAQALTDAGHPTLKTGCGLWRESSVRAVIDHGRWLLDQPAPWPALWSAARLRPAAPRGGAVARRHAITGLLRCRCGGVVVGGASKRYADGTTRRTVRCRHVASGRPRGRACPYPHTYADRYEAGLGAWLRGIPDLAGVRRADLPDVDAARAALAERRRVAGKRWETGSLTEPEYDARIAALALEEAALPLLGGEVETVAALVVAAQALWPRADPVERNDLLRGLIERANVGGDTIEVVPRPALAAYLAVVGYALTAPLGPL